MRLCEIKLISDVNRNSFFSDLYSDWRQDSYKNENYSIGKLGRFDVQSMHGQYRHVTYALYDMQAKKYAAFLELEAFGRYKLGFDVVQAGVRKSYQGQGLMLAFYQWLVKRRGITLVSGLSQSPGGRKLWEKLANSPGIFVYGYDLEHKKYWQIDPEDIENENIYDADLEAEYNRLKLEFDRMGETPLDRQKSRGISKKLNQLNDQLDNSRYNVVLVATRDKK